MSAARPLGNEPLSGEDVSLLERQLADLAVADSDASSRKLAFSPTPLPDGIELSDDPILRARREAYELSQQWRGATSCPF